MRKNMNIRTAIKMLIRLDPNESLPQAYEESEKTGLDYIRPSIQPGS